MALKYLLSGHWQEKFAAPASNVKLTFFTIVFNQTTDLKLFKIVKTVLNTKILLTDSTKFEPKLGLEPCALDDGSRSSIHGLFYNMRNNHHITTTTTTRQLTPALPTN